MSSLASPRASDTPLIGRARETERLREILERGAAGEKRVVLLAGVAGVGKSALLRWAADQASEHGYVSALVRAPASAGLPPRFPVGEILTGLAASCEALGVVAPDPLHRMIETLTGSKEVDAYPVDVPQVSVLFEGLAEHAPILLLIDDIQWAAEEGMRILVPALRLVDRRVVLVATARGEPGRSSPEFLEPSADLRVDRIDVGSLEPFESTALAEGALEGPLLPSLAETLAAQTVGNPLFIIETLRDWQEAGDLVRVGGYWSLRSEAAGTSGRSIQTTVGFRLGRLDARERGVAQALAILGRAATFSDVCAISNLEPDSALEALDILERRGLCVTDPGTVLRYRLGHPLYASCITAAMTRARQAAVHAQIFAALLTRADGSVPASELAHHAVAAHQPPANLRELLDAAAAEAEAAGSFREAATWYAHLAELVKHDPRALQEMKYRQARASVHFSPDEAAGLYTDALELATTDDARADILTGRAYAYRVVGEFARAMSDLEEALPRAKAIARQHIRHAVGVLHGIQGRIAEAESALTTLRVEALDSEILGKATGHLGLVALSRGDITEAERFCRDALACAPTRAYANFVNSNLLWLLTLNGRWDEAYVLSVDIVKEASSSGDLWNLASSLSNAARLYAWRGEIARGIDAAARSLRLSTHTQNPMCKLDAHAALALALYEGGSIPAAQASMHDALIAFEQVTEPVEDAAYLANAAEILIASGDQHGASKRIEQGLALAERAPHWRPYLERLRCEIAYAGGDMDRAKREILLLLGQTQMPFEAANQSRLAGRILWDCGDKEAAILAAEQALATYGELGATPRAQATQSWIAARKSRPRGRPSNRKGGLTVREWEVLNLVSKGMSNTEIASALHLSPATVRSHVERLRRATGTNSRTQLALYGTRQGLPQ